MRTTRLLLLPLALAAFAGSMACSDGDDGATADVATLDADAADDAGSDAADAEGGGRGGRTIDPEFQDAMVEFAECMREHGIDMPDPQIGDGGGVIISGPVVESGGAGEAGGPVAPSDAQIEEMEAAHEACEPILEEVEGNLPELDPEQEQEMRDNALEFAECMREHGIDMPDPVFDAEGGTRVEIGVGGPGAGGIDPGDEDFQEAQEACGEEIGFGPGFGFSVSTDGAEEGE